MPGGHDAQAHEKKGTNRANKRAMQQSNYNHHSSGLGSTPIVMAAAMLGTHWEGTVWGKPGVRTWAKTNLPVLALPLWLLLR